MKTPVNSAAPVRVGLVHATLAAVQPMVAAFRQYAPQATLLHFLDEGLLPMVNRDGLNASAVGELERLIGRALATGAQGVLLTCSAYSPAVPALQQRYAEPLISADDAMLRGALEQGSRIGVVATVTAAGPTTEKLLRQHAATVGKAVRVITRIIPEAFAALQREDGAGHDELVRQEIRALMPLCDVVVLAQISMARAVQGAPSYPRPVLTSPEVSIRALVERLSSPAS